MENSTQELLSLIKTKKQKQLDTYKEDYLKMIAEYNGEKSTADSYNGRQILELLQNCDDQRAEKVIISIDTEKSILSVMNDGGNPFSMDGYDSLFYKNLSSKRDRRQYIGNKGLGLRSLRAISNNFCIKSNGIALEYSRKAANIAYKQLFDQATREEIQNKYILEDEVPMPFFSCPKITTYEGKDFTTEVSFNYKNGELANLNKQIDALKADTMLFLTHISRITILRDKETYVFTCDRQKARAAKNIGIAKAILNGKEEWTVFQREGDAPKRLLEQTTKGENFYQIKVAYHDGAVMKGEYLRCFFPTLVEFPAPYLVHATFDLDPNRNHLCENALNKYIAGRLAELIVDSALHFVEKRVDWEPLKMLFFPEDRKDGDLKRLGFYELLENAVNTREIFPCVDNTYRKASKVFYISDRFSEILSSNKSLANAFSEYLLPLNGLSDVYVPAVAKGCDEKLSRRIHNAAHAVISPSKRAELVQILSEYPYEGKFTELLIDSSQKSIAPGTKVYSPSSKNFKVPSFCGLTFINNKLYKSLVEQFKLNGISNPQRKLHDKLEKHFDFFSYEPAYLLSKIIDDCNARNDRKSGRECIIETIKTLFENYQKGTFSEDTRVTYLNLLTVSNHKRPANELTFSARYRDSKYAETIFANVFTKDNFLASPETYCLDKENQSEVKEFFQYLGVNQFCQIKETRSVATAQAKGEHYFRGKIFGTVEEVKFRYVENLDNILTKLSREQVLLWICKDKELSESLTGTVYVKQKDGRYRYKDYFPSYVRHCFLNAGFNYEQYLLDPYFTELNDNAVRYDNPVFCENDVERTDIENALRILGAKEEIWKLAPPAIASLLQRFGTCWPTGETTQTRYKNICHQLGAHGVEISKEKFCVFARIGKQMKFVDHNEVYFSDHYDLPSKVRNRYPIFNYPKRQQGDAAIKIFGIKDLNEISVDVIDAKCKRSSLDPYFQVWFERMKPLALVLRLKDVTKNQQDVVKLLEGVNIHLYDTIYVSEQLGESQLGDNEYAKYQGSNLVGGQADSSNVYCVQYSESSMQFHKQMGLVSSLAEILASTFNLVDDAAFELLLSKDYEEAKKWIVEKYGLDALKEAYLFMKREENGFEDFCSNILSVCGLTEKEHMLLKQGKAILNLDDYHLDYDNISKPEQKDRLHKLFVAIGCSIVQYNSVAFNKINYESLHARQLERLISDRKHDFEKIAQLCLSSYEDRIKYLDYVTSYELYVSRKGIAAREAENFEIDLDAIWSEVVHSILGDGVSLDTSNPDYVSDRQREIIFQSFTTEQQDYIRENKHLISLLYFPNTKELIIDEICKLKKHKQAEDPNSLSPAETKEFHMMDCELESFVPEIRSSLAPKAWVPGEDTSRRDKRIGDKAQDEVFNYLVKQYGEDNVDYTAKKDEGMHYDLKYRDPNDIGGGDWKYVEVKNCSGNSFEISKDELEMAKRNWQNYELWLNFKNKGFTHIKDLFNKNGECKYDLAHAKVSYTVYIKEKTD